MQEFVISKQAELATLVPKLVATYGDRDTWLLSGDLGAGKTTFTTYLAAYLGIEDDVSSPTFALINEYVIPGSDQYDLMMHIDLYRLDDIEEALNLGIEEILDRTDTFKVIEWPALIEPLYDPERTIEIQISELKTGERKFVILERPLN